MIDIWCFLHHWMLTTFLLSSKFFCKHTNLYKDKINCSQFCLAMKWVILSVALNQGVWGFNCFGSCDASSSFSWTYITQMGWTLSLEKRVKRVSRSLCCVDIGSTLTQTKSVTYIQGSLILPIIFRNNDVYDKTQSVQVHNWDIVVFSWGITQGRA